MPLDAAIEYSDAFCTIGVAGPILVSAWLGPPNGERIARLHAIQKQAIRQPDPLGGLILILGFEGKISLPDDTVRREMASMYEELKGRRVASAVAIEAKGFLAATARGFLTGLLALSRTRIHQKVFDDRRPALAWLGAELSAFGRSIPTDDLLRATHEIARPLDTRA